MSTRPRTPFSMPIVGTPRGGEMYLSGEELARAAGISPARLVRLVHLGLVESVTPGASQFTVTAAVRLRRMLRLYRDLGVNLAGAAIIVDLLERLERVEAELVRQRAMR